MGDAPSVKIAARALVSKEGPDGGAVQSERLLPSGSLHQATLPTRLESDRILSSSLWRSFRERIVRHRVGSSLVRSTTAFGVGPRSGLPTRSPPRAPPGRERACCGRPGACNEGTGSVGGFPIGEGGASELPQLGRFENESSSLADPTSLSLMRQMHQGMPYAEPWSRNLH